LLPPARSVQDARHTVAAPVGSTRSGGKYRTSRRSRDLGVFGLQFVHTRINRADDVYCGLDGRLFSQSRDCFAHPLGIHAWAEGGYDVQVLLARDATPWRVLWGLARERRIPLLGVRVKSEKPLPQRGTSHDAKRQAVARMVEQGLRHPADG